MAKELPRIESNIAQLRQRAHLTQDDLAHRIGVAESSIRNWEGSKSGMKWFYYARRLCEELNCDIRELITILEDSHDQTS